MKNCVPKSIVLFVLVYNADFIFSKHFYRWHFASRNLFDFYVQHHAIKGLRDITIQINAIDRPLFMHFIARDKHMTIIEKIAQDMKASYSKWITRALVIRSFPPHPSSPARRGSTSPPKYFGFAEVLHARQCSNAFDIALA